MHLQPYTLASREPAVLVQATTVCVKDMVVPPPQMSKGTMFAVIQNTFGVSGVCRLGKHAALDAFDAREPVHVHFPGAVSQQSWSIAACLMHMVLRIKNYLCGVYPHKASIATSYGDCVRNITEFKDCLWCRQVLPLVVPESPAAGGAELPTDAERCQ